MSNVESRRGFLKSTAYVAPAILTLAAAPSFAKSGSEKVDKDKDKDKDKDRGPKPNSSKNFYGR